MAKKYSTKEPKNQSLFDNDEDLFGGIEGKADKSVGKAPEKMVDGATDSELGVYRLSSTDLMKLVAMAAPDAEKLRKNFSNEDIANIMANANAKKKLDDQETGELTRLYFAIKRKVLEMEHNNKSRIIVYPDVRSGMKWWKVLDFSALYFRYHLAERMGRSARIFNDADRGRKAIYTCSIVNIDEFDKQMLQYEGAPVTITEDGVHIYELRRELTSEEYGILWRKVEDELEAAHNTLRPQDLMPDAYKTMLELTAQIVPKATKLPSSVRYTMGNSMITRAYEMLTTYFDYSYGLMDKTTAGMEIMSDIDMVTACLAILLEMRTWAPEDVMSMGGLMVKLKKIVERDFDIKIYKKAQHGR